MLRLFGSGAGSGAGSGGGGGGDSGRGGSGDGSGGVTAAAGGAGAAAVGSDAAMRLEASRALYLRFGQRAGPVLTPVATTLEHMLRALQVLSTPQKPSLPSISCAVFAPLGDANPQSGVPPPSPLDCARARQPQVLDRAAKGKAVDVEIDSAIPQSLFGLYTAAQAFWQSLDDEWAATMARFLHLHSGAGAGAGGAAAGAAAGAGAGGGVGGGAGGAEGQAGLAPQLEVECFVDFLKMGSLLGQLRQLCQHTANMSWRMANIIQKKQPKRSFIPEPDDLYRFEVQV